MERQEAVGKSDANSRERQWKVEDTVEELEKRGQEEAALTRLKLPCLFLAKEQQPMSCMHSEVPLPAVGQHEGAWDGIQHFS